MHTKPVSRRSSKVRFAIEGCSENEKESQINTKQTLLNENFDDGWIEEETLKRDHTTVERLSSEINKVLLNNPDVFLSFCPDLPNRISEYVSLISRDEPGGVSSCRVRLNVVTKANLSAITDINLTAQSGINSSSLCLGSACLPENGMIETFEVNVYLFPSSSVLSKLQSIVSNISQKIENRKAIRLRNVSLLPDFVVAKRKLFRSSNSKPLLVVKSIAR